ncbi:PAS domain-containing protein [Kiloniella laminariae]|uniref:PAS domain-containing protein n=1 Tax=Kiloniella laminariae TaxID=454162 RepID=UPI00035C43C2|nr:PAS domain-containing protein [Kiloniella laminariae]
MAETIDIPKVLEVSELNIRSIVQANLYRYWLQLKADKDTPDWQDFDPCVVRESLPDIMLYDAYKDGNFFVCITGENCRENFGIPSKRSPLDDVFPARVLGDVKNRLTHVLNSNKPHLVQKNMNWKIEASPEEQKKAYTVLFLPFRIEHPQIKLKILNSIYFHR